MTEGCSTHQLSTQKSPRTTVKVPSNHQWTRRWPVGLYEWLGEAGSWCTTVATPEAEALLTSVDISGRQVERSVNTRVTLGTTDVTSTRALTGDDVTARIHWPRTTAITRPTPPHTRASTGHWQHWRWEAEISWATCIFILKYRNSCTEFSQCPT